MTTTSGQQVSANVVSPVAPASQKHLQIAQDAEKAVTDALQKIAIDKELLSAEAWVEFSTHVAIYMRDLYELSLQNKHPLDSNISRSCVHKAYKSLAGRALFPNIVGAFGGAVLGAGVALILGIWTATVTDSTRNWLLSICSSVVGLAMLTYQFYRKS